MSKFGSPVRDLRSASGRIESRLLLNAIADPIEVSAQLPEGVQPHVGADGGTVIGCCLLEIAAIRPWWLPEVMGVRVRAVAHRISAEWVTPAGELEIGVFVPMRYTDSRIASVLGGRWFPGVHQRAEIQLTRTATHLDWSVWSLDPDGIGLDVRVDTATGVDDPSPAVRATCIHPTVGLSPDCHDQLEAVHMAPDRVDARAVGVEHLQSTFLAGFATAVPAPAYLIEHVGVAWSTTSAKPDPRSVPAA